MNLTQFLKRVEKVTVDNSPAILTAIGITGTLTTAYLTGKASIKAAELVREENEWIKDKGYKIPFDKKETVKLVWKLYLPAAASATLTIAAIVGANHVSTRRATAMATAYTISEKAFVEYKDKVVEKLGEKKERAARDEIAQDRVSNNPVNDNMVVITENGDVLCYDHFSGRYFKSSMEALRQAENTINAQILSEGYASLTDLYFELGLPRTSISDEVGWNTSDLLKLEFSTVMSPDQRPCISIDFRFHPSRKFSSFAEG